MINGLSSKGKYIYIHGGHSHIPYISPGSAGAGMIRWNPNTNQLEVNDGNIWIKFSETAPTIGLTDEAEEIMDWARGKMREERRIKELCQRYPALQKAKDNYDLILNIIKDENENQI
jgi:hypothetical protein